MKLSKEDFDQTITQLDSQLAKAHIPIHARPMQATIALFKTHNSGGPLVSPGRPNITVPVTPENLSTHVNTWYESHYGNKIKVDPSPGRFPLLIEGAAYQCRVPLIFGQAMVVASKHHMGSKQVLNAIDHIVDLPELVRSRLSGESENYIQAIFFTCIEVSNELSSRRTKLKESAQSDSRLATDLLCGHNLNSSMSAWHSLQLAEKVLKQHISKHEEPPHTHDIKKLSALAKKHGYVPNESLNLDLFNFGASTRYEPHQISMDQAVLINHEAWRLAFDVLKQT